MTFPREGLPCSVNRRGGVRSEDGEGGVAGAGPPLSLSSMAHEAGG